MGENWTIQWRGSWKLMWRHNGPIPNMTSWQNALTSTFYYLPYLTLLHYIHTSFFSLLSLISLEVKMIKIHVNFFIAVRSLILKFRDVWCDLKSMIFIAQGYWLFTSILEEQVFPWAILAYPLLPCPILPE